jgi:hypothetical protein
MSDGDREELERMLAAAGLPAGSEDVEAQLATVYPLMREAVAILHALPEAREEIPALRFEADPEPGGPHDGRGEG